MNVLIYETKRQDGSMLARAYLTNEVPESHYGLPVLFIENGPGAQAYGWADMLPSRMTAAQFLRLVAQPRPENHALHTRERQDAIEAALANIRAMGL